MRVAAVQTLAVAENSNTDLKKKLTAEEQARKSVDSALEQTLLLSRDMVELRGLRKNEVFLNTKRYLGMVWC